MALWDNAACMELDRALDAQGIRHGAPTLGSTLGSPPGGHGHTDGSNHYPEWWGGPPGSTGQARDYGDKSSDCNAIAEFFEPFAKGRDYVISELIWTRSKWPLSRNGIYYKRGIAYTPSFSLARQHNDHDHVAIAVGRHLPAWVFRGTTPSPVPAPVTPPEEDYMAVFIEAPPDTTWWLFDGVHRRPVGPGENQTLVDLGLVKPGKDGKPTVKRVDAQYLNAIPKAAGYP